MRGGPVFSDISSDEFYLEQESDTEGSSASSSSEASLNKHTTQRYHFASKPPEMINGRRELNLRSRMKRDTAFVNSEGLDLFNSRKARLRIWAAEDAVPRSSLLAADNSEDSSSEVSSEDLSRLVAASYGKRLPYFSSNRPAEAKAPKRKSTKKAETRKSTSSSSSSSSRSHD
eukprot:Gregarina_sp_Pseudo_9__709@NODE_1450_length_1590_cov_24_599613_g1347_i0_p2_GENE_NODE_1450_length_1590_cov_24_599613_g1347_i0NODE_1450_length_1590_cov_24_599613_g1347_i0_p2_ORF_typecomplete_len173_score29_98_NODE_1450_length_1590_cov_24_599613_g1347_i010191537